MAIVDHWHGASITFGSSFFAQITNIQWSGLARVAIPTTHSATTGGMTHIPGDLYEPGELQVDGFFDNLKTPITPIAGAAETVTLTLPIGLSQSTACTISASGFMISFDTGGPTDESGTAATFSSRIKLSGTVTFTAAT